MCFLGTPRLFGSFSFISPDCVLKTISSTFVHRLVLVAVIVDPLVPKTTDDQRYCLEYAKNLFERSYKVLSRFVVPQLNIELQARA